MTVDLAIVLILLGVAVAAFAVGRPRMDAVALVMLVALPFTGVITVPEALAGFGDENVVLIAALFVLGNGLVRTGVARALGDWLTARGGSSERRLMVMLMLVAAGAGAVMSSTAVTAIFIPVVLRICRLMGISPRQLMMPLSVAALISGMLTLVATTPNLIVNGELERTGHVGFGFFSFTPFGLPVLLVAIAYMIFARRWLAGGKDSEVSGVDRPSMRDWVDAYQLAEREYRVQVTQGSPAVGRAIGDLEAFQSGGAKIVAIERRRGPFIDTVHPTDRTAIQTGDVLLLDMFGKDSGLAAMKEELGLESMPRSGVYFADRSQEIGMAEVIIPPDSELAGQSVIKVRFRTRYGLTVIGLRRGKKAHAGDLLNEKLKPGDMLLLVGPWKAIDDVRSTGGDLVIVNLPTEFEEKLAVRGRAAHAVLVLLLVIGLMVSGVVPNVQAALIGCLLMGALGCVDLRSSYRAIDWKTIVLIVGMLPFSLALQRTGGVELGSNALMTVVGNAGDRVILASLFAITAGLGLFISNTATAVLMAPVALTIANDLHASPLPFAMTVALAASTAFMTPVSSPVNTLVVTPGRYSFADFVRVGVPLAIVVMVICVIMVPWLLPLHPP